MLRVQETLVASGTHEFTSTDDLSDSPLAQVMLAINGIELILIAPRFVTIRKADDSEWPDIAPEAKEVMREFLGSSQMAVLETNDGIDPAQRGAIEQQILKLLDEEIRPAIAMDGGDLNYIGFEDGIVKVQMIGACGSCPSSTATLKMGIERLLMEEVPEVRAVEQV